MKTKLIFTAFLMAVAIASCKKDEPEPSPTPTPVTPTPVDTNGTTNTSCFKDEMIGKLYCELKDTTGLTGTQTTLFRITDTIRTTPIVFCGGALANPYKYKHYKFTFYGWGQVFPSGNWKFQEISKTYYRDASDCKFYPPLVNGSRCNAFNMATIPYNPATTSNHIMFRKIGKGDSIWVIDMHGDGVGSGAPDMYSRDSMKLYLIK